MLAYPTAGLEPEAQPCAVLKATNVNLAAGDGRSIDTARCKAHKRASAYILSDEIADVEASVQPDGRLVDLRLCHRCDSACA